MQKYNKAWAGGLAAAITSVATAFVELEPSMEVAIVVILTSVIVAVAPSNKG